MGILKLFKTGIYVRLIQLENNGFYAFHTHAYLLGKGVQHPFRIKSKKIRAQQEDIINSIKFDNQHGILADFVTPHWKISYEEELAIKQNMCKDVINQIFIRTSSSQTVEGVLQNIIPSPTRDAYRCKDEFSVWPGLDGDPKTVGFFVGSPAVGKVVCVEPTHIRCVRESHKKIAKLYQNYIRSSPLPVCYQLFDGGFWRNIIIQSNEAGDHMALVITHPGNYTSEQIAEQEELLRAYFQDKIPSLALFHQSCQQVKCTQEQAPIRHLSGKPHIVETVSDCQFRISPGTFFQVNRAAAEILFREVIRLAGLKHFTTLLDLYCGTGAVSLAARDLVRGTVGVDENASAVDDARHNAKLNGAPNCSFIKGTVENSLPGVLKSLNYSPDIVAVMNPGRGGCHESVISLLRQNSMVRRVVFVACRADNPVTMKNFVMLCQQLAPGTHRFRLTKAQPVDVFPYTSHCELILCFDKT